MRNCINCNKDISINGKGNFIYCSSVCNIKYNSLENKNSKIIKEEYCIEYQGRKNKNGYGITNLQKHENYNSIKNRSCLAHRKIFQYENPDIDISDKNINHHCDNPSCINPKHLYCGTQQENVNDMIKRGRGYIPQSPQGETHHKARLTDKEVWYIRFKETDSQRTLSKKYKVNKSTIGDIKNNKTRKYVTFEMFS